MSVLTRCMVRPCVARDFVDLAMGGLASGAAEVAFVVVDDFQRQGIGAVLLRHLAAIARAAGLKELVAEVSPDNIPMLKVFEKSGLKLSTTREPGVVHVALELG